MSTFIDDVMDFDSTSLEVFQEKPKSAGNANVYRTSPSNSKSEDGHYRSKIRVIYNPYAPKKSIVHQATYAMTDSDGFFIVKSMLGNGDRNCPLFKAWKKLHFSDDENKKAWAKQMFDKSESDWCLVQILEDQNQPELVGQVKVMKLPKAIFTKMSAKMNPSAESGKTPVPVMDYLIGLTLDMDVTPGPDDPKQPWRKQREISYDLCEFDTEYAPIIKVDGTPLFTDEEMELIEKFDDAKKKLAKAKTDKAKKDATAALDELTPSVKALYVKALTYLKDEAQVIDLEKECTYQPWSETVTERVNRWIEKVLVMQDPKTISVDEAVTSTPVTVELQAAASSNAVDDMMSGDVPF